jgi:hypothetical protein
MSDGGPIVERVTGYRERLNDRVYGMDQKVTYQGIINVQGEEEERETLWKDVFEGETDIKISNP